MHKAGRRGSFTGNPLQRQSTASSVGMSEASAPPSRAGSFVEILGVGGKRHAGQMARLDSPTPLPEADKESPSNAGAPVRKRHYPWEDDVEAFAAFEGHKWQKVLWTVISSAYFDMAMGVVIIFNSANIGYEQALRLHDEDTTLPRAMEHVFLVIYCAELFARFIALGWPCLNDAWVNFDCFLVFTGVLFNWLLEPLLDNSSGFGPLMTIRICRLLRLSRMLRLLGRFQVLWMMVRGLIKSINTMAYTLMLLLAMFYIFGVVSLEFIATNEYFMGDEVTDEAREVVEKNFMSLPMAMLTMMQFVTFDNVVLLYRPLVEEDWTLVFLFGAIILVVGIVLMNLVTAVIVQGALDQALQDQELQQAIELGRRKKLAKDMTMIFYRLDKDGSGEVSRDEIAQIEEDDKAMLKNLLDTNDPVEIFDALDVDGSGGLMIDEFVDGIWEVSVSQTPLSVKRMQMQIESVFAEVRQIHVLQEKTLDTVNKLVRGGAPSKGSESETLGAQSQPLSLLSASPAAPSRPCTPADALNAMPVLGPYRKGKLTSPGSVEVAIEMPQWVDDFVADMQHACAQAISEACHSGLGGLVAIPNSDGSNNRSDKWNFAAPEGTAGHPRAQIAPREPMRQGEMSSTAPLVVQKDASSAWQSSPAATGLCCHEPRPSNTSDGSAEVATTTVLRSSGPGQRSAHVETRLGTSTV